MVMMTVVVVVGQGCGRLADLGGGDEIKEAEKRYYFSVGNRLDWNFTPSPFDMSHIFHKKIKHQSPYLMSSYRTDFQFDRPRLCSSSFEL
jgi:hypothetical protein